MQVAKRVRQCRESLDLTQMQLAAELGVTHQHVSKIELAKTEPSLDLLVALSRRLGVSIDYLLTGQQTAPADVIGAIRSQRDLSATAKRHLIGIISELQAPAGR